MPLPSMSHPHKQCKMNWALQLKKDTKRTTIWINYFRFLFLLPPISEYYYSQQDQWHLKDTKQFCCCSGSVFNYQETLSLWKMMWSLSEDISAEESSQNLSTAIFLFIIPLLFQLDMLSTSTFIIIFMS